MITFLDENDAEYGALATIKATNAVNGERSITGEIISGDIVLSRIERGWRLRFEDEYYVVTFAKPIDEGKNVQVSFDAVHQFFWDFGKSSVYDQLSDGSHTFRAYLDFIFNGSGYRYDIESSLTVKAFEKQSFGYKNRLSLFNDIITSSGVEFQVNGKVVRILAKVGTDLSTVVRKNFNLNELGIEKNIRDFVTYQKGFGAYFDEEDHSKGRLIAEYTSPLASVYGKLEADPLVDERYKQPESLLSALKETVDNSYTISVSLDMEDLTRAGYRYTQPVAGDYIMAINETLGFKEKIRIVSFTSEYDVSGQLIKHTVTCNDIGSVKKLSASYTQTQHQAANAEVNANTAYEFANKALVSANGKNTNYYGDTFPVDNPKGTLKKGDLLFLTVGDAVKQYYWNGADWVINPVLDDVEAFKEQIADELKDVPNREEFENKISEELANSKAEIETQIETAKTQAESNAKEYADTINQETTKVAEQANAAVDEIKADLVNVKNNLTDTSLVANNAQASVDKTKQDLTKVTSDLNTAKQDLANSVAAVNTKVDSTKAELTQAKQDLTKVTSDLNTAKQDLANSVDAVNTKADSTKAELTQAKQDLTSHAQQLQTQANAQTELTKRVTTVETTANGTKTTVNELTKTVAQNGKDITSVTNRTKTVEDDLANTKTTLTQVQTTANSTSQKTATLETGLNGLNAKFETLKVGSRNYFKNSKSRKYYIDNTKTQDVRTYIDDEFWKNDTRFTKDYVRMSFDIAFNPALPSDFTTDVHFSASPWYNCGGITFKGGTTALQHFDLKFNLSGAGNSYKTDNVFIRLRNTLPLNTAVSLKNFNLYLSAVVEDYTQNEADIESKVAEYKQNADQNYASLQTTVQKLDGTVQHNKTVAEQTAEGFKTRIESLETYKDGETTRANQYFESAKTETARQLTVERTAIAKDYVAKSTYTSDVAGIRNELSATTTTANTIKTDLANYQATNNRAVANLQSNIQTANGDISSLKTKVEAVPGQITSAVSAVESKIPTEIGSSNLLRNTAVNADNLNLFEKSSSKLSVVTKDGYQTYKIVVSATNKSGVAFKGNARYYNLSKNRTYTFSFWVLTNKDTSYGFNSLGHIQVVNENGDIVGSDIRHQHSNPIYSTNTVKANTWTKVWCTFKATSNSYFMPYFWYLTAGDVIYIYDMMLNEGNVPLSYTPAFEDTISQISSLSSEIKQTADGMTLLATKTELNTAKSDLQSGISTATSKADNAQTTANSNAQTISNHTTQISALNTGLNAKVSQSDFDTLSGRVTTAENNITAKANELSSKITSVEGKIPTELGVKNLIKQSTAKAGTRLPPYAGEYQDQAHSLSDWIKIEPNATYTLTTYEDVDKSGMYYSLAWYSTNNADYSGWISRPTEALNAADLKGGKQYTSPANAAYAKVSYPTKYSKVKLERGKVSTDYTPAPEDTVDQISSLSSQIKQTADGITLLATKTELNSAKNELQSGINTATNKANTAQNTANSAQNTANSNAQTISNHTTQISALNTGLNAKVSQSDFDTLSGRVTTAENNITAKANELSSKITSVEGKIPTSVGGRNYIKDSEYRKASIYVNDNQSQDEAFNISSAFWQNSNVYAKKIKLSFYYQPSVAYGTERRFQVYFRTSPWPLIGEVRYPANTTRLIKYTIAMANPLPADFTAKQIFIRFEGSLDKGRYHNIGKVMLEVSDVFSDWQPAPEDAISQISTLSSELKQTQDGITLLATKTELNSTKNELQSGINTATNKANTAQNTANSAQNTANSNAQTISNHTTQISALNTGLNAKVSQSDFDTLSGRVTTAENNITAKANELSSKITSVEGKIPTELGVKNLIKQSTAKAGTRLPPYAGEYQDQAHSLSDWIKIEPNTTYTLTTYEDVDESSMYYSLAWYSTNNADYSGWISRPTGALNAADLKGGKQYTSPANAAYAKVSYPTKYSKVKLERGKVSTDYTPAPEDYDSKLASVQSEIKQTTDSITASVQSLDNSTVKSSSLTINSDGIVMKAGKSPSDFANAIGSYFSVNPNAINLFSDKINVKGNMIVSGAITSDKIASKQINTAHLNGKIITADVISSNAVTADAIKAGAVTTDKMSANSINGDRITAGTLDAAKIKAGSITASQIASGTITSAQIKAGTISAANIAAGAITSDKIASNSIDASKIASNSIDASKIAAGAITSDKIASNSIDASKIAAGAITANMITGGQLRSTNGATMFDLNAGTLTFNNNYGYIHRVAGDKIFEITTYLGKSLLDSQDYLTSAFKVRKSDNSRQAGIQFSLYNMLDNKPTAIANIHADSLVLYDSKNTQIFSVSGKDSWSGTFNLQGWGDIPMAHINGGLIVKDIGIGGHIKTLLKIVEELCKKTGIMWI